MSEIIRVNELMIGGSEVNAVDARELWIGLSSKREFATWMKNKVIDNPFFEKNLDWVVVDNTISPSITGASVGGCNKKDYVLTLDTAVVISNSCTSPVAPKVYECLCGFLGKNVVVKHHTRMEQQFGEEIIDNLFSKFKVIPQYSVLGGKYNIDWYIPELKLAIEFDEMHHRVINNEQMDLERQNEIEVELGCKFARYNVYYKK